MSTPPQYTVIELPSLGSHPWAAAINENAVVAGWLWDPNGYGSAVIWHDGLPQLLQSIAGDSAAYAVNNAGQVVGTTPCYTGPPHAFLYPNPQLIPETQDLNPALGGGQASNAFDVNDNGVIVGSIGNWFGPQKPFVYEASNNSLVVLDPLPGHSSAYASAINEQGHVVGISEGGASGDHAFSLTNFQIHDLGEASTVSDLSNNGVATGAKKFSDLFRAFRLDTSVAQPVYEQLGSSLVGIYTQNEGLGINDSGVVVGVSWYWGVPDTLFRGFVNFPSSSPHAGWWDLQDVVVDAADWVFEHAASINNKGQIVGRGTYQGKASAFLLTPVKPKTPRDSIRDMLLGFVVMFGGAAVGAEGWGLTPGGKLIRIPPRQDFVAFWTRLPRRAREAFVGRAVQRLASLIDDPQGARSLARAARDLIDGIIDEPTHET